MSNMSKEILFTSQIVDWKVVAFIVVAFSTAMAINIATKKNSAIPYIVATSMCWILVFLRVSNILI